MDTFDLFKQLTRGARFTSKNANKIQSLSAVNKRQKLDGEYKLEDQQKEHEREEQNYDADLLGSNSENETEPDLAQEVEDEVETEFHYLNGNDKMPKRKKPKKETTVDREKQLEDDMINNLRREQRISVLGRNIPPPLTSFADLQSNEYKVHDCLVNNLLAYNYPQPTPIQMQAIPIMLKGRPLMACAPTGSGKTIAFLTPIINDLRAPKKVGFRALILAPTRELAQQIFRECVRLAEKTALRIHFISKVSQAKQKFGPDSSNKFDILVSTPNRVRFLLQQEPPLLHLERIEWFVIDEADRLMEDGQNNFKEQLDDILGACTNPNKKLALFSATYTVPVAKWALKNLKNLARVTVGQQNAATESVEQELLFVGSESGKLVAIRDLVRSGLKPPVLVFVQSKERAKQLFEELLYDGINVDVIHADRTQQQRDNCVRAFREGNIWVLICTELMGRGIDFKGVNLVINYDFPPTTISYIHRIGRTGRAGRPGKAITFFTQDDTPNLRSIAHIIKNSGGKVPEFMLQMKKVRKSEKKKLANFAPKRDDISTKIKAEVDPSDQSKKKKVMFKPNTKSKIVDSSAKVPKSSKPIRKQSKKELNTKTVLARKQQFNKQKKNNIEKSKTQA